MKPKAQSGRKQKSSDRNRTRDLVRGGGFPPPEPTKYREVVTYSVPATGQYLPNVYMCEHTYADIYNDTTGGGFVDWVYRGNSTYDPDYGAGGGRAIGHAQMSGMYLAYKVIASSAEITCVNNDDDDPVFVCLTPTASATAFSIADLEPIISRPRVRWLIAPKVSGDKRLTHAARTVELFDLKDLDDAGFTATGAANPAQAWYWHLTLFNKSGNALNCLWSMKLRYTTRWSDLAQSFVQ